MILRIEWYESKYTQVMVKSNYKNVQDKWHENHTNWFIKLIEKIFQNLVFLMKFQIIKKTILNEWFLFIYLQKGFNLFSINDLIQLYLLSIFIFKKVIYTYFIKTTYYKISIWQQKLFLFSFIKNKNEFLLLYLQKYLSLIFIYKGINFFNFIYENIFNSILS